MEAMMKTNGRKIEMYEVVSGTRTAPGAILRQFSSAKAYKCGGPATACLRWFDRETRATGAQMFFRKVA